MCLHWRFFLYLLCQFCADIYDMIKKIKKYYKNIWKIKTTSLTFDLSNQKTKQNDSKN